MAALVVLQALDVFAVEGELAAGEGLQQPGDVEEGGLAGTGRTGDGDELAFLHVQVERTQSVRRDQFGAVDLGDLAHVEHRRVLVRRKLGRAAWRERVCTYVMMPGVAGCLKKRKERT